MPDGVPPEALHIARGYAVGRDDAAAIRDLKHSPAPVSSEGPFNPSPALLVKLGSIIVHFDEGTSPLGHQFDLHTARQLLADPEVADWISKMTAAAMLPVKRNVPARQAPAGDAK